MFLGIQKLYQTVTLTAFQIESIFFPSLSFGCFNLVEEVKENSLIITIPRGNLESFSH